MRKGQARADQVLDRWTSFVVQLPGLRSRAHDGREVRLRSLRWGSRSPDRAAGRACGRRPRERSSSAFAIPKRAGPVLVVFDTKESKFLPGVKTAEALGYKLEVLSVSGEGLAAPAAHRRRSWRFSAMP